MSRVVLAGLCRIAVAGEAHAQSDWKKEWEKNIEARRRKAGERLTSAAGKPSRIGRVIKSLSRNQGELGRRPAPGRRQAHSRERRAGKFLADVTSEGIGSNYPGAALGKSFDPIKSAFLLRR